MPHLLFLPKLNIKTYTRANEFHPPSPQVFDFETAENFRRKYVLWQRAKNTYK